MTTNLTPKPTNAPRALIADDERLPREQILAQLARVWPELNVVAEAADGSTALALIRQHQPDVVFLDIRMPELNGLEVAIASQQLDTPPQVVFLTAYDEYAMAAFDAQAFDYLLKPIDEQRLRKTVHRLQTQAQRLQIVTEPPTQPDFQALLERLMPKPVARLRWIQASVASTVHFIAIEDVLWFRSDDKYTEVRTRHQQALIRSTLKELEPQLDPEQFWTIHRNCIVAVAAIERAERDPFGRLRIKIRGLEQWLDVSRSHSHRFKGV